jgi:hypothetical protein
MKISHKVTMTGSEVKEALINYLKSKNLNISDINNDIFLDDHIIDLRSNTSFVIETVVKYNFHPSFNNIFQSQSTNVKVKRIQLKDLSAPSKFRYLDREFQIEGHLGDKILCRRLTDNKKIQYSKNIYVEVI